MGDDPPHRLGPGGVPSQGHATDYGESTTAASGWELRPPSAVYGDAGSGILRYGGVFSKDSEYCCTIYCNATDSVPLRGYGADAREMGRKHLVGKRGPGPGMSKGRGGGDSVKGKRRGRNGKILEVGASN